MASPSPPVELPIIDLKCSPEERLEKGKVIVDNLENVGFFIVDNVDLDFDKLLEACKWFFSKPEEYKHTVMRNFWKPDNPNLYRGYYPIVPGDTSRKEAFEFGEDHSPDEPGNSAKNWMMESSPWPAEDGTFPFKEFLTECYGIMMNAAKEVLDMAGLGLEKPGVFKPVTEGTTMSTFRIIHYEPWKDDTPPECAVIEDGKVMVTPEHCDTNFLTLLCTFGYPGLEVKLSDGTWLPVQVKKNMLVFNIGNAFESVMNYRFKATAHRVIDIGKERYSVPFFLSPPWILDIGQNYMQKADGQVPTHEEKAYGRWENYQTKYVKKYAEYKVLPDIE